VSDVSTRLAPFTQADFPCRCEWGVPALTALAPADVLIIVDVFSFTTCVDVAVSRGATILPYGWTSWDDPSAVEFAQAHGAELAGKRRRSRYSLAPSSYLEAPWGLRCVLPSPNGARVTMAAAGAGAVILAGCLRNAGAVAAAAARIGQSFNVIPSGERWLDGTLRPSVEDMLGAGAILSRLPGIRSPEAAAMVAVFESCRDTLVDTLDRCGSGRELAARGHHQDKLIAGELDVSTCVPRFNGTAYVTA
jgi:2-phosphosulfolactate phosphatase